ncbi:DUF4870 domain-containing protein [Halomarina pelagica]|uniref:DUF4870 domain-containing protein n=1 Tax=Halomarina pelagica TaxID=2961599 RepID=UPI0020C1E70D|nr:DUF4870 domain-containing protein [Halomarina sp. BND7]
MTEPTESIDGAEPTSTTDSGLDSTVLAALSYVLGFVTGLVVYLVERDDEYVRFHAAQSMTVFGLLFLASVALTVIQTVALGVLFVDVSTFVVGSIVSLVLSLVGIALWLGGIALWLYLIVRAYQGKTPRIPVAAGLADRLV